MIVEAWPPEGVRLLVAFEVAGDPKGAGSKNAIAMGKRDKSTGRFHPYTRSDGTPMVNVVDSSGTPGKHWREKIAKACMDRMAGVMHDGPIAVRVTFYGDRPKGHYGTGRNAGVLKDWAPPFPHSSDLPDGTKLARALEDALNAVAWSDDRRVCDLWWSRRYGDPGASVEILAMPESRAQPSLLDEGIGEITPLSLLA